MPTRQFTPQTPGQVQERLHHEMGKVVDDVNWRDPGAVIADEENSIPSSRSVRLGDHDLHVANDRISRRTQDRGALVGVAPRRSGAGRARTISRLGRPGRRYAAVLIGCQRELHVLHRHPLSPRDSRNEKIELQPHQFLEFVVEGSVQPGLQERQMDTCSR